MLDSTGDLSLSTFHEGSFSLLDSIIMCVRREAVAPPTLQAALAVSLTTTMAVSTAAGF
jgi:hypothetical protein